jgi:hypothetical protein
VKIIDNGKEKKFVINNKKEIKVLRDDFDGIEFFESEDPTHTGCYFSNIQEFYYFINALTDIAKKFKDESCQE